MIFRLSKQGDNEEVAQFIRWKVLAMEALVHMHSHTSIGRKLFRLSVYRKMWVH